MKLTPILLALIAGSACAAGALNPDVRQDNIQQTVCVRGYTATVRPEVSYTNGVKKKLMREAGISYDRIHDYELDHVIPLALGGHPRKLENLQLQPWDGENGAHRKDRIEVKLQCLVCAGQVPLVQAQREIAENWQAAYHRYAPVKCHRSRKSSWEDVE